MPEKDETKGTPQDESKGTPKDESKGTPKKAKGKLYTEEAIAKLKSDSAAMAQGRAEKVAKQEKEALTQELQDNKNRLDALEREANESRLAEARGDPTKLRDYQRDQAAARLTREQADKGRDLARREAQLKIDREQVDEDKGVVSVAYVAAKHGLKTETLEELGITDLETLEKVAVKLAAAKPKEPGKGDDADREAYQALETDAEREAFIEAHPDFEAELDLDEGGTGGKGERTEQQKLDERYPTMKTK